VEELPHVAEQCYNGQKLSTVGRKLSRREISPGDLPTACMSPAVQQVSCIIMENRNIIIDEL